ncbi:MAG: DNA polymerase II large subunit [Candidatus Methanomethylophilaceae archaeon]|nr:DNA polymerase II large subunit [Candidatus Methanomethylophilaceae archaeon]
MPELVYSEEMGEYFRKLAEDNERCYDIARKARRMGRDPENKVEVPQAEDLASRVEKLLKDYDVKGIAETIRKLTDKYKNRELVSLYVAKEMAKRDMGSKEKSLDTAIRAGLAVLTEGILVAPLEGLADTKIGINDDGTEFVDLVFAGPIRAAGGTAQAMSVLLADVVRTEIGIGEYKPTEAEVDRFIEEIPLYKMCQHIQYSPSAEEIKLIVGRCPIMIDGEGTEKMELSGFRDLPRIKTNQVRGGACLVVAEGMCQKASKLQKHVKKLGLKGWEFMDEYLSMKGAAVATDSGPRSVHPSEKYLKDIVAGRPIFGHPSRVGGFRLRYGRARTAGLASLAFCPASMYIMDEFPALGTQLKIERPGKACVVTPCDELDGPIAVLNNGDLVQCQTSDEARTVRSDVFEITDNGEVLVPFGEFCENNHFLIPSGYPIEWHVQEIEDALKPLPEDWHPADPTASADRDTAYSLKMRLLKEGTCRDGFVRIPVCDDVTVLESIGAPYTLDDGNIILDKDATETVLLDLMVVHDGDGLVRLEWTPPADVLDWNALSEPVKQDIRGRILIGSIPYMKGTLHTLKNDVPTLSLIGAEFTENENKVSLKEEATKRLLSDLGLSMDGENVSESSEPPTDLLGWSKIGPSVKEAWTESITTGRDIIYSNGTLSFPLSYGRQLDIIGMEYMEIEGSLRLSVNNTVTLLSDLKLKYDDTEERLVRYEDKPPDTVFKWGKAGKAKDKWADRIISGKDMTLSDGRLIIPSYTERTLFSLKVPYMTDKGELGIAFEDADPLLENLGLYRYKRWVKQILPDDWEHPTYDRAKEMSRTYGVPLHPDYNLFWNDIPLGDLVSLRGFIASEGRLEDGCLTMPLNEDAAMLLKLGVGFTYVSGNIRLDTDSSNRLLKDLGLYYDEDKETVGDTGSMPEVSVLSWSSVPDGIRDRMRSDILSERATGFHLKGKLVVIPCGSQKKTLETLGAIHKVNGGMLRIDGRYTLPLIECLGLSADENRIVASTELSGEDSLGAISKALGIEVRARAISRIGMRMGRPEKAKDRKGAPVQHGIFAVTNEVNNKKDIIATIDDLKRVSSNDNKDKLISPVMGRRSCPQCGGVTFRTWCRNCGSHTNPEKMSDVRDKMSVDIIREMDEAVKLLGVRRPPEVKVLEALTSKAKVPEPIEKAILRQLYDLGVYKDGTIRFDMSDIPITHFRPREVGMSVEQAHQLGYVHDMDGDPLTDIEQMCELKVQDVIPNIECGRYLVQIAKFMDHLLEKFYNLPRFYNVEKPEDLIGHLTIGLAPHTSGGILCRIIGYTEASGCYAHPFFHASKRRNCDGDEDCLMLLLDGLINFSRAYLPDRRVGLMDAPLVLTTRLDPNEIDKEAQNVDCLRRYPKEFYEAAMELKDAKDVEKVMDLIAGRIGTIYQYEGLGFTLNTNDINEGPKHSAYTTLETMRDKMDGQLSLGKKIRAVDEKDVAIRVIDKHFMPDMIGNLRSYSAQGVRCVKCGTKYRRIPLTGRCTTCNNELTLTVHEASVRKYLEVSKNICEKYDLPQYTRERIMILELSMDSLFNSDKVKKCTLSDFF